MPGEIVNVLQFAIDGISTSENSTSNNIANVQTPDYTASETNFEQSLDQALNAGGPATATITTTPSGAAAGIDGNNVSLSDELVNAEKESLQFQTVSESLNAQFRLVAGASGGSFS